LKLPGDNQAPISGAQSRVGHLVSGTSHKEMPGEAVVGILGKGKEQPQLREKVG